MFRVMCVKCNPRLVATATSVLLIVTFGSDIQSATAEGTTSSSGTWLAPGVEDVPGLPMGPFVRLGDGSALGDYILEEQLNPDSIDDSVFEAEMAAMSIFQGADLRNYLTTI